LISMQACLVRPAAPSPGSLCARTPTPPAWLVPQQVQVEALQSRMHAATLESTETKARVYELVAEANSARRQLAEVSKELDRPSVPFASAASWAADRLAAGKCACVCVVIVVPALCGDWKVCCKACWRPGSCVSVFVKVAQRDRTFPTVGRSKFK
jgi:hypothetical protein